MVGVTRVGTEILAGGGWAERWLREHAGAGIVGLYAGTLFVGMGVFVFVAAESLGLCAGAGSLGLYNGGMGSAGAGSLGPYDIGMDCAGAGSLGLYDGGPGSAGA